MYLNSPWWRYRSGLARRSRRVGARYRCDECLQYFRSIDIHHLSYDNAPFWLARLSCVLPGAARFLGFFAGERFWQLAGLCRDCHRAAHGSEKYGKR